MTAPTVPELVLGDRYQVGPLLGAGGMAEVYDGWDARLDRPVAIKLLRADLAAQAGLRRRFELEARAAARLTHPNVVAVYDAGEDQDRSFIVMERLPGESLADVIARGPVDLSWLRRLATETVSAIGAAHAAGIVHRDIKPSNILIGPDGRAKVADFGIARVAEVGVAGATAETAALTGAGLVVGTPAYLAPERAMGEPATVQSDLYSLGVVLYEAVTGRKPYAGSTPVAVAAAAVHGLAENPLALRPDADPQLVAVIGRAMAREPAERYATAAQMATDLRKSAPPATSVLPRAGAVAPPPRRPGWPLLLARLRPDRPAKGRPLAGTLPGDRYGRRRWLVTGLAILAVAAVAAAILFSGSEPPRTAADAAPTTRPATAPSTTAPSTTARPASDPMAVALAAEARVLGRSTSVAAPGLAQGLMQVASITDPAARAQAASTLLGQAVQWYRAGQLTSGEYAASAALLHMVGAPQGPPPTVRKGHGSGKGDGGDGG